LLQPDANVDLFGLRLIGIKISESALRDPYPIDRVLGTMWKTLMFGYLPVLARPILVNSPLLISIPNEACQR
jgi:hypothetical protein